MSPKALILLAILATASFSARAGKPVQEMRQYCRVLLAQVPQRTVPLYEEVDFPLPESPGPLPAVSIVPAATSLTYFLGVHQFARPNAFDQIVVVLTAGIAREDHSAVQGYVQKMRPEGAPVLSGDDLVEFAARTVTKILRRTSLALPVEVLRASEQVFLARLSDTPSFDSRRWARAVARRARAARYARLAFWLRALAQTKFDLYTFNRFEIDLRDLLIDPDPRLAGLARSLVHRQWRPETNPLLLFGIRRSLEDTIQQEEERHGIAQSTADLPRGAPAPKTDWDALTRLDGVRRLYNRSVRLAHTLEDSFFRARLESRRALASMEEDLQAIVQGKNLVSAAEALVFLQAEAEIEANPLLEQPEPDASKPSATRKGSESARTPLGDATLRRALDDAELDPRAALWARKAVSVRVLEARWVMHHERNPYDRRAAHRTIQLFQERSSARE